MSSNSIFQFDDAGLEARRAEYAKILNIREPLAGLKRDEVLENAIASIAAIQRVIAFRDELKADDSSPAFVVARAFADEIDRALKGQR